MDQEETHYRQRMDDLNYMMADRGFPPELRSRCRMYLVRDRAGIRNSEKSVLADSCGVAPSFEDRQIDPKHTRYQTQVHSKDHHRTNGYAKLEELFSTELRGAVAATNNSTWLVEVWYMKAFRKEFVVELSHLTNMMMFAPAEPVNVLDSLFLIQSGIAARRGRVLPKGAIWGCDFILEDPDLIDRVCAAALSYASVAYVTRDGILSILADDHFAMERSVVARASRFYKLKALLLRASQEILKTHPLARVQKRARRRYAIGTTTVARRTMAHGVGFNGGARQSVSFRQVGGRTEMLAVEPDSPTGITTRSRESSLTSLPGARGSVASLASEGDHRRASEGLEERRDSNDDDLSEMKSRLGSIESLLKNVVSAQPMGRSRRPSFTPAADDHDQPRRGSFKRSSAYGVNRKSSRALSVDERQDVESLVYEAERRIKRKSSLVAEIMSGDPFGAQHEGLRLPGESAVAEGKDGR